MYRDLEHPEIGWIERTGYPSWKQEKEVLDDEDDDDFDDDDFDSHFWGEEYDRLFEESRERELFGDQHGVRL